MLYDKRLFQIFRKEVLAGVSMFIHHLEAYSLADDLAEFWKDIAWFRMYCVGAMGEKRSDYQKGLESLKNSYKNLIEHPYISKLFHTSAQTLIVRVQDIVNTFGPEFYLVEGSRHREQSQAAAWCVNSGLSRATVSEMS